MKYLPLQNSPLLSQSWKWICNATEVRCAAQQGSEQSSSTKPGQLAPAAAGSPTGEVCSGGPEGAAGSRAAAPGQGAESSWHRRDRYHATRSSPGRDEQRRDTRSQRRRLGSPKDSLQPSWNKKGQNVSNRGENDCVSWSNELERPAESVNAVRGQERGNTWCVCIYLSPKWITVIHASFWALQQKYLNTYWCSENMYFFTIHSTSSICFYFH